MRAQVNVSRSLKDVLRGQISKLGYPGELLDTPSISYTEQPGYAPDEILNDRYDEGLRYVIGGATLSPNYEYVVHIQQVLYGHNRAEA